MESPEDLSRAIELYELQLNEVRQALERASPAERPELETLEANVLELLELTRQNLNATLILRHSNGSHVTTKQSDQPQDSALDSEYALFKAELAELETSEGEVGECSESPGPLTTSDDTDAADIQEELDELVGSKCQAPYTNKVQASDYYNALVLSTHVPHSASDLQHIQVRVMFTNPIEREMIPCPFYLDGDCKFSDDKCNFSHGYLVPLSKLREYREPDFSRVRAGCEVLAKPLGSDLWVWTRVEDILSLDTVSVRHEGNSVHVPLQNILPLHASTNQDEHWNGRLEDSGTEEEDRTTESGETPWSEAAVERSLLDQEASSKARLGQWEQHTKGIGSKLLARMGYVVGAGLGRRGEGILEPVEAVVLPPGKSLDHCMKLREEAGGSKNLFSVERIQKKLAAKAQRRSAQIYRNKKQQDQNNVFTIINSMTSQSKQEDEGEELSSSRFKKRLESSSERWLNVEKVKTEETMERTARDVRELGEKLSLKPCGSVEYRNIASRLQTAKARLETLQKKNVKIAWEINTRETKKKMAF